MRAPDVDVCLSTGTVVALASLYAEQPVALVFLRHLGCIFCREHVSQLRRMKDLNIAFVVMAGVEPTAKFRDEMASPHVFICDPERHLYRHFDIPRGDLAKVLHPQVLVRGLGAILAQGGQRRSQADPLQMPGVVVIQPSGEVSWQHVARHVADNPPPKELRERLES